MTDKVDKYDFPNMGCLLGMAFQTQYTLLSCELVKSGLDITPPEYLILRVLYDNDGLQQCEIASSLGKDQGAVCRSVKELVRKDLVRTEAESHKCRRVYISEKGKSIRPEIMDVAKERQHSLETILTPPELKSLKIALTKIINNNKL